MTGIRPDAQWNGNATGSARRNRLVALGLFSLNFNFMLLLLVFSNPGNLNIIVTGVTAIATSRGRTHHDQRCRPAAINDGVIFAAILIPSAAMHHQLAFPISSAGGGNCWWAATCAFGGNMCLRRQCYLRRQYYPLLSRALCWESVPPPILNLSPTTSSSDTLPPGSPGDRLRGIQRRASGHKSAARRFLHKLRRAHRHLIVELLSMSPGGK